MVGDPGDEPEHKASAQLYALETRLDYMGSSILMGRVSQLAVILTDYWKVETCDPRNMQNLATTRWAAYTVLLCDWSL